MTNSDNISQERLIRLPELLKILQISKSNIWSKVKTGDFPQPVKLGRCTLWKSTDIQKFIDDITSKQEGA